VLLECASGTWATTIDVGLISVVHAVAARRRLTDPNAADAADTVGPTHAHRQIEARRAAAAAIDVGLIAVPHAINAAHADSIEAINVDAVGAAPAASAVGAGRARRAAAIDVRFIAVLHAIRTAGNVAVGIVGQRDEITHCARIAFLRVDGKSFVAGDAFVAGQLVDTARQEQCKGG
jgi:hypothetical protein